MIWLVLIFGLIFYIAKSLADDSDKSQKHHYEYKSYSEDSSDNRPFCNLEAWEQEGLDEATWYAIHCDKNYGKPYEEWE